MFETNAAAIKDVASDTDSEGEENWQTKFDNTWTSIMEELSGEETEEEDLPNNTPHNPQITEEAT